MHSMYGRRWAMHVYVAGEHVQCSNHSNTMVSYGRELWLLALLSIHNIVCLLNRMYGLLGGLFHCDGLYGVLLCIASFM